VAVNRRQLAKLLVKFNAPLLRRPSSSARPKTRWEILIDRENHMTESSKLIALRSQLLRCRRAIVDRFQEAITGQLNGDDIARIQDAIDAADRAIADEILAEYKEGRLRRAETRHQLP
jgi:hypothetical protein